MIQDREKFLKMIYDMLWGYAALLASQIVLYIYYPQFFDIYEQFFSILYLFVLNIFEFFILIIDNVFLNYSSIFFAMGILILCFTFYKIAFKIMGLVIRGGKKQKK